MQKCGMYHRQIEVSDIKKSYQRLEKAELKHSTDALIMAAQEQELVMANQPDIVLIAMFISVHF